MRCAHSLPRARHFDVYEIIGLPVFRVNAIFDINHFIKRVLIVVKAVERHFQLMFLDKPSIVLHLLLDGLPQMKLLAYRRQA